MKKNKKEPVNDILKGKNLIIVILLLIIVVLLVVDGVLFIKNEYDGEKYYERYDDDNDYIDDDINDIEQNTPSSNDTDNNASNNNTSNNTKYIGKDKALNIVLKDLKIDKSDIRDYSNELDYKFNKNVYEIEFKYKQYEYEYYVDANSGDILKSFKEFD